MKLVIGKIYDHATDPNKTVTPVARLRREIEINGSQDAMLCVLTDKRTGYQHSMTLSLDGRGMQSNNPYIKAPKVTLYYIVYRNKSSGSVWNTSPRTKEVYDRRMVDWRADRNIDILEERSIEVDDV